MRRALLVVALTGLACGGLPGVAPAPPPAPVDLPPEPAPEPAQPVGRTTLPADPFEPLDGFLAVAPLEGASWAPPQDVLIVDPTGWDEVAPGATFRGLWSGGSVSLAFQGVKPAAWGCGDPAPRAVLSADGPVEGVVWVTQEPLDATPSRPHTSRPPTADRRLYAIPGGAELDLRPGRSVLEDGGARPWLDLWTPSATLDLRSDHAPGPAYPELAWTSGDELDLVLRRHRHDGVELLLLRVLDGRRGEVAGKVELPKPCP